MLREIIEFQDRSVHIFIGKWRPLWHDEQPHYIPVPTQWWHHHLLYLTLQLTHITYHVFFLMRLQWSTLFNCIQYHFSLYFAVKDSHCGHTRPCESQIILMMGSMQDKYKYPCKGFNIISYWFKWHVFLNIGGEGISEESPLKTEIGNALNWY